MRILIVEDDPMLGEGLQTGLQQAGFQPEWVKDGEAFAALVATFKAMATACF